MKVMVLDGTFHKTYERERVTQECSTKLKKEKHKLNKTIFRFIKKEKKKKDVSEAI